MMTLTGAEMTFLAGKSGLEVYDRAIEFGNFHVYEWLAQWARENTEGEKENDNGTERV